MMTFHVIGIDDSSTPSFNAEIEAVIGGAKIFSGGARHHEIVGDRLPRGYEWINITPPMKTLFESYQGYDEVVVFASGDPLFYGFVATIQRLVPDAEITTYPHFNSLQLLAHRLTLPYQDMRVVSLTGRDWLRFDEALIEGCEMIGILTDNREHTPAKIAARMVEYGYTNYTISVGTLLGNQSQEEVFSNLTPEQVSKEEFAYPNNIILRRQAIRKRYFGIPEGEFTHLDGREKMITKMPIRLTTLSLLDLRNRQTFWDIGFCTGSVSIEAKMQFPHLNICSFEIREEGAELMRINSQKFGTPGIKAIIGDFLTADLSELKRTDAIFIGGYGGKLEQIMEVGYNHLNDGGMMVINSVSESSCERFTNAAIDLGMAITTRHTIELDEHNKITIIKAEKHE